MYEAIFELSQAIVNRQASVLATIVKVEGASPTTVGVQIVLPPDGKTTCIVGGGKLEASILEDAQQALKNGRPGLHQYRFAEEGQDAIGTLCDGEVTVFVQPYFSTPKLVIVGSGHIGRPLKLMGEAVGFDEVVVDVTPGHATVPELEQVNLSSDCYTVLITIVHISTDARIKVALKTPVPYIGMIGSLSKGKTIFGHLQSDGYSVIGLTLGTTHRFTCSLDKSG